MLQPAKIVVPMALCMSIAGFAAYQNPSSELYQVQVEVTLDNYVPVLIKQTGTVSEYQVQNISRVEKDQVLYKFSTLTSSTPIMVRATKSGVFYPIVNLYDPISSNQVTGYILQQDSKPTIFFQLKGPKAINTNVGSRVSISDGHQVRTGSIQTLFVKPDTSQGDKVGIVFDDGLLFQLLKPGAELVMTVHI
ncbi:hypothetical protein ORJ00_05490 [Rheinheimera baltica]|uniref:hypothetical protein n=1 Tax=Rheinheimera baltica TaxID=67576 RepID=UPI00273D4230|nr:hypothetical protein [Rheinheimera baltica]MDP5142183.1 hypothetical protein [Rheinheimera baltica]